jgi:putative transposase
MTPHNLHFGHAAAINLTRQSALDRAFLAHPERFRQRRPQPPALPAVAWINPPKRENATGVTTPPCTVNS